MILLSCARPAATEENDRHMLSSTVSEFELRGLGSTLTSGRVTDVTTHLNDQRARYVAVGSSSLKKATSPETMFDDEGTK